MLLPKEIIDYVVVHELCHLKEMNHSARFYGEIEKILLNYREHQKWLKEKGYIFEQDFAKKQMISVAMSCDRIILQGK